MSSFPSSYFDFYLLFCLLVQQTLASHEATFGTNISLYNVPHMDNYEFTNFLDLDLLTYEFQLCLCSELYLDQQFMRSQLEVYLRY